MEEEQRKRMNKKFAVAGKLASLNKIKMNREELSKYLSAEKAKQIALEQLKENASNEYETKVVLEEIEDAARCGFFEMETYDNKVVRDNLTLLGYNCSEPFIHWGSTCMKVSWL